MGWPTTCTSYITLKPRKYERFRDGSLRKPEINPRAATLFAPKADNSKTWHLLSTIILLLPLHSLLQWCCRSAGYWHRLLWFLKCGRIKRPPAWNWCVTFACTDKRALASIQAGGMEVAAADMPGAFPFAWEWPPVVYYICNHFQVHC